VTLKTATTQCDCPPAVKRHFKQWLLGKKAFPIVVYEAVYLKVGITKISIITVTAPLESRIQRVIERDTTRDQILGRINSQWTDEQRVLKSDYVIINIDSEIAKKKTEEILKILKIKQKDS
jgi:dephospho-CoA kinase